MCLGKGKGEKKGSLEVGSGKFGSMEVGSLEVGSTIQKKG